MAYFDVRPSSHAPTLELRVCDACPLVDDVVLIAGIFRGMVRAAELDVEAGRPFTAPAAPLHRAAIWQAARSGLSRQLVDGSARPTPRPAADVVRDLVGRLRPQLEELGDWETVTELAESVLARGNSADRQRTAFAERGKLEDVVRLVVAETHGQATDDAASLPTLRRYRVRAGDEALGHGSVARPAYRDLVAALVAQGSAELTERAKARDTWVAAQGPHLRRPRRAPAVARSTWSLASWDPTSGRSSRPVSRSGPGPSSPSSATSTASSGS